MANAAVVRRIDGLRKRIEKEEFLELSAPQQLPEDWEEIDSPEVIGTIRHRKFYQSDTFSAAQMSWKAGASIVPHYHTKEELLMVVKGELYVKNYHDNTSQRHKQGDCITIHAGERHYCRALEDTELVVIFR